MSWDEWGQGQRKRIVELLAQNPRMTVRDLGGALGLSGASVQSHLTQLVEAGVIEVRDCDHCGAHARFREVVA